MRDDDDLLLAAARRGLSPRAGNAARVRAGVLAAVSVPPQLDLDTAVSEPTSLASVGGKLLVLLTVAATSGSAGYYFGERAGRAQSNGKTPLSLSPVAVSPIDEQASPPPPGADDNPANQEAHASPRVRPSPPALAASAGKEALDEEVRTLKRVERALRAGNPQLALALLQELDRAVPAGKLSEERRAAFTVASCEVGFGASRESLLQSFVAQYPRSVYLARVKTSCGGDRQKVQGAATDSTPSDTPSSEGER